MLSFFTNQKSTFYDGILRKLQQTIYSVGTWIYLAVLIRISFNVPKIAFKHVFCFDDNNR